MVKFVKASHHCSDLAKLFRTTNKYQLKLNLLKCVFGVAKFLGFMLTERRIEASSKKCLAIINIVNTQFHPGK